MKQENTTTSNNRVYDKPRDMFDDACLLIFKPLEEYGFKYSKSQATLKKKDKLLTYSISFYSSHYNYIVEGKGHVVMEFYCFVRDKEKDIVFRLNQKELRSEIHRFELFDNETGRIDLKQIESVNEFIKTHFLPVVFGLQNDTDTFLENIANQPVARFDDYGFQCEKKIFEIFNRQDLIEKYNEKIKEFNDTRFERNRISFKKYILQRFDKNKLTELNISELQETVQDFWASADLENKVSKEVFEYKKKYFNELLKKETSDKTDWLIEYYIFLCSCKDTFNSEETKEQVFQIYEQFRKCFINNQ